MFTINTRVLAGFKPLLQGVCALSLALSGTVALASTVSLDFTDSANFAGGTINGYSVSIDAHGGSLTTNVSDRAGCEAGDSNGGANLHDLACDGDGLGVGNDEISYGTEDDRQSIKVTVGILGKTRVESIEFLDLFQNDDRTTFDEVAQMRINDGAISSIVSEGNIGGYLLYTLGQDYDGASIVFEFFTSVVSVSDFAVARINLSEVPIPGALLLFGSGIWGLGFYRRQRQS